ncbi:MAG TPA: 3-ketoacyl-ACP reductase [Acidobacteriaceae bacterium]|nr:3-ketoacyl-ACP reductase [Acidobacteriaceae bacterium]
MVALITGGSRGIGLGIAFALGQGNYTVVITGRRPEGEAKEALSRLAERKIPAMYLQSDVSSAADRSALITRISDRFGRIDVLVNNAGIAPRIRADILNATEESFDEILSINTKGPYFLTQSVAHWMIELRKQNPSYRGCIVNVSSVSATVASVNRGDYCISKAGVAMATRLWAVRLAEFGIDVYEVRPGIILTDMTNQVKPKYDSLIAGDLLLEKRWGTPEDVGRAVRMLVQGDLPYASGSVLTLDGGMTIPRL